MMTVAIIETVHFQYGLTVAELFEQEDKIFFVTQEMHDRMHSYAPDLCKGQFVIIGSVGEAYKRIIEICNHEPVDLLFVNPIFTDFQAVYEIATQVKCEKVITIHGLNFWFRARFRTPKYYRERKLKQRIVERFDHVATGELVFNYVMGSDDPRYKGHNFLHIPWTLFRPRDLSAFKGQHPDRIQVVQPGMIDITRRSYKDLLAIIDRFAAQRAPLTFSFPGPAIGDHGKWVISKLEVANGKHPGIARYYPLGSAGTPELFLQEMATSDIAISTLNPMHSALGTTEYYGKTKVSGFTCDIVSYQLPGLLPAHLAVPPGLVGSAFNYASYPELERLLNQVLDEPETLRRWQDQAKLNSTHYTAEVIRKNLPFFSRPINQKM